MTFDWKHSLRLVASAVAAVLGLVGLSIAAAHGSGSHYQGGVALFVFMVLVLFWQVGSVRYHR